MRPSGPAEMFATEPPALEALAPYALTPLRLARPLARTTRTRNETETDFPIELIPSISDHVISRTVFKIGVISDLADEILRTGVIFMMSEVSFQSVTSRRMILRGAPQN